MPSAYSSVVSCGGEVSEWEWTQRDDGGVLGLAYPGSMNTALNEEYRPNKVTFPVNLNVIERGVQYCGI